MDSYQHNNEYLIVSAMTDIKNALNILYEIKDDKGVPINERADNSVSYDYEKYLRHSKIGIAYLCQSFEELKLALENKRH